MRYTQNSNIWTVTSKADLDLDIIEMRFWPKFEEKYTSG